MSSSYDTAMTEPNVMAAREAAYFYMEHVLAVHTVTCATENMAVTCVESHYDDTKNKQHPSQETVVKSYFNPRSEISL